jgi:pilus assembly protein CpaF
VLVQVARQVDGRRKLISLQEITGMEGNIITMQEIFSFQQTHIDPEGNVKGRFKFHGVRPKFIEKFKVAGIPVSQDLFDPAKYVEV